MTSEEAMAILEIEVPYTRKVSCPSHEDSTPSLHVYPGDGGFYCYSCNTGGDGWNLLALYTGKTVGELMRERGHAVGPRPRSKWEQIRDIRRKANILVAAWTLEMRESVGLPWVAAMSERIDYLYSDLLYIKDVEELVPVQLDRSLDDLKIFLDEARRMGLAITSLSQETIDA